MFRSVIYLADSSRIRQNKSDSSELLQDRKRKMLGSIYCFTYLVLIMVDAIIWNESVFKLFGRGKWDKKKSNIEKNSPVWAEWYAIEKCSSYTAGIRFECHAIHVLIDISQQRETDRMDKNAFLYWRQKKNCWRKTRFHILCLYNRGDKYRNDTYIHMYIP